MAKSEILKSKIAIETIQIGANSANTISLPTAYTEAIIFVYRSSLTNGGVYAIDSWGQVATIISAPNITITKATDSNLVYVTDNNGFAVRAKALIG